MNWSDYVPTPKMAFALYAMLFVVASVLIADWLGLADVRPAAAAALVALVGFTVGWFKRDS